MGTRGVMGLVIDSQAKIGYQQFDSYPTGVGTQVLNDLRDLVKAPEELRRRARELRVVSDDTPPTNEEIFKLSPYANLGVSSGSPTEWYALLRNLQGELAATLEAGYIEDHQNFALDSGFCEWGYVVDLDAWTLQVYRGYQRERPRRGRWAGRPTDTEIAEELAYFDKENPNYAAHKRAQLAEGNYPMAVELIEEYSLDALPTDEDFEALEKRVYNSEED